MVDDDAARARERVLAGLRRIYGTMPGVEAVPVSGTPDDVGPRAARGDRRRRAEMPAAQPVGAGLAENREQMERLAAEVIPHLLET